jgi:NADH-quinone oxidoreductase subunit L
MIATVVFLPLLASLIAGILAFISRGEDKKNPNRLDKISQYVTCAALIISTAISILIFKDVALSGNVQNLYLFNWIGSGTLNISWSLKVDSLTAVMLIVVTVVSSMVHIYSIGYMNHDPKIPRFMAYLSLFTFFMLMLVTADNLVQMFFGWEGVGLASYLLIGFWYHKPSANSAAIKAFVVNRVGDFGFMLGIFTVYLIFDTVSFEEIFAAVPQKANDTIKLFGGDFHAITIACLLLFIGAMGKSAQLGLHTWLPDAMEGPTPVSALIHAATMVTAGVFMVARLSPLFEFSDTALTVVTIVGGSTAIFAATIACTQNDIKRVIAYSTCSQLGYMFFACGISAYSAGVFHLMTHGFFKALLFLGAGSVIHAMSDEQDMRKMGGLGKHIKVTYVLVFIGSLALVGIWPFAGFYSKDIILEAAWAAHTNAGNYAFWMGVSAAFLTAFYSWRLIIMTFHGNSRSDETVLAHVHESPKVMLIPLIVLAVGAGFSGYIGYTYFVGQNASLFWGNAILVLDTHTALEAAHHAPIWVKYLPMGVGFFGIFLAYVFYMWCPRLPGLIVENIRPLYNFVFNKWYFDELYGLLFVNPVLYLGRNLWKTGDGAVIDGIGPDGISAAALNLTKRIAQLQTGYLYHYAFAMIGGIIVLISIYMLGV